MRWWWDCPEWFLFALTRQVLGNPSLWEWLLTSTNGRSLHTRRWGGATARLEAALLDCVCLSEGRTPDGLAGRPPTRL